MKIMDFMSFDLSWFKSLPGILLILGCFCLIIAIILIPTLTKKKDDFELDLDPKEGEELLNKVEDIAPVNKTVVSVNKPIVEEIKEEVNPVVQTSQVVEEVKPLEVNNSFEVKENISLPIVNEPVVEMKPEVKENIVTEIKEEVNPVSSNLNVLPVEEIKLEPSMPIVEEVKPLEVNNSFEVKENMTIPEVIPSVETPVTLSQNEEITIKNDSFGGEKLLPDDFKIEINERKEAFGGEKLLPDDFKPEIEKPHLSNTQSFSLRDIAIQKEQPVTPEVKEEVIPNIHTFEEVKEEVIPVVEPRVEAKKEDIELLEL